MFWLCTNKYGIMTEKLVIREIRIDGAAGRGDSDQARTQVGCTGCPGNHLFVLKFLVQFK